MARAPRGIASGRGTRPPTRWRRRWVRSVMAETLSDWLSRREAADFAARSTTLLEQVVRALPATRPLRIVDLGTGTGSNVRYLSARLPRPQEWLVVDRDASLLDELTRRVDVPLTTRSADLGTLTADLFAGRQLVTGSALLDLVAASWLEQV